LIHRRSSAGVERYL